MIEREQGLLEIRNRLKSLMQSYPLKYFKRSPTRTITQDDVPALLILEGEDIIIKRSSKNYLGYPLQRALEIIVEIWDFTEDSDVKQLREEVLKEALENNGILAEGIIVREKKTIGPFNLNVPDVLAMQIVFEMVYRDDGPF